MFCSTVEENQREMQVEIKGIQANQSQPSALKLVVHAASASAHFHMILTPRGVYSTSSCCMLEVTDFLPLYYFLIGYFSFLWKNTICPCKVALRHTPHSNFLLSLFFGVLLLSQPSPCLDHEARCQSREAQSWGWRLTERNRLSGCLFQGGLWTVPKGMPCILCREK